MDGTVVTLDRENRITRFIGKGGYRTTDNASYYKTVNIYKFSSAFLCGTYLPALEAYRRAHGDNEYYERVLGEIVTQNSYPLSAQVVDNSQWYEIDDADDLAAAEERFASTNATEK